MRGKHERRSLTRKLAYLGLLMLGVLASWMVALLLAYYVLMLMLRHR